MTYEELLDADGPLLVLSGPGFGKTYFIANRVAHLVKNRNVDPAAFCVATFTGASTGEMRRRLSDSSQEKLYLTPEQRPELVCTLHSLGARVLAESTGTAEEGVRRRVVPKDMVNVLLGDASQALGLARVAGREAASCRALGACQRAPSDKCRICEKYREIVRVCSAIDYNDQILLACEALRDDPGLLARWRQRTKHFLVDEFQDINGAQSELIRLLSEGQDAGLVVVGDDDQSIYSWRGGSPQYIREFRDRFGPEAHVEALSRSRRCHPRVLESARCLVQTYDPERLDKGECTYEHDDGDVVVVHCLPTDDSEAGIICGIAREAGSSSILVLVPNRLYMRKIAARLASAGFAVERRLEPAGQGVPALQRLAAWLLDQSDSLSLRECIECMLVHGPIALPGPKTTKPEKLAFKESSYGAVSDLWAPVLEGAAHSLWDALCASGEGHHILVDLQSAFDAVAAAVDRGAAELLSEAAKALGAWRNVDALFSELDGWVELADEDRGGGARGRVRLMTHQGAKGLEADVVVVVGLEDSELPGSAADEQEVAEKSRLLYVSMTRAKKTLHLSQCRTRSGEVSHQKPGALKPSRFLALLPKKHYRFNFVPSKSGTKKKAKPAKGS